MNKDVLINVTGLQMTDSDGNSQPIEMIVPGNYYFKNGSHYLRYEEILDESGEPTVNYVKLSPTSMEVRKKGLVNVHMVFEKGKKNMASYTTPFGTIRMGIAATGLSVAEEPDQLCASIKYSLDMNDEYVADCSLTYNVRSKTAYPSA
ncbi:MAG: DUF1934 domain-containing protein [Blautia sp.]|nr:DUF1934 domain-containing protein [Blautia sp.]